MALRWTALAVQLFAVTNKASGLNVGFSSQLRNPPLNFRSSFTRSIRTPASVVLHVIPEPGACPKCQDENGYWDGSNMFACIGCGHEWPTESVAASDERDDDSGGVIRDSNGNVLENGDTVVLTKELGKGLKKGLKIRKIRIGDYGDGHDVEASIPKLGTFALKSQFLKKTK
eukprot:CAMPEP_0198260432 /NCGR_PEP_ID=MMETSP1447-20131203/9423_1 /TAXON_ID=420782 /ORGANISM="Chaetoceros dichaeta, Strain CCMP1751" /LENGTH=171 /DNA_ID=CAMNT_0043948101 /DNA_START=67 /DNA_END=582 /DNA_ORIENTATION=+